MVMVPSRPRPPVRRRAAALLARTPGATRAVQVWTATGRARRAAAGAGRGGARVAAAVWRLPRASRWARLLVCALPLTAAVVAAGGPARYGLLLAALLGMTGAVVWYLRRRRLSAGPLLLFAAGAALLLHLAPGTVVYALTGTAAGLAVLLRPWQRAGAGRPARDPLVTLLHSSTGRLTGMAREREDVIRRTVKGGKAVKVAEQQPVPAEKVAAVRYAAGADLGDRRRVTPERIRAAEHVTLRVPDAFLADKRPDLLGQVNAVLEPGGREWTDQWPRHNRAEFRPLPPLPDAVPFTRWDAGGRRLVIGATDQGAPWSRPQPDGAPLLVWDLDEHAHALIAGATGGGKTVLVRSLAAQILARGWELVGIDGKGNELPFLEDRQGVLGIAYEPEDTVAAIRWARDLTLERFRQWREAKRAMRRDRTARLPEFRPVVLLIDEHTEAFAALEDPAEVEADLGTIARKGRAALVRLLIATQRPDVGDGLTGNTRDQLTFRVHLGAASQSAAGMLFGSAHVGRTVELRDGKGIPGRGTAGAAGRWARVQTPWIPDPLEDPDGERWFPDLAPETDGPGGVQRVVWAPEPIPGADLDQAPATGRGGQDRAAALLPDQGPGLARRPRLGAEPDGDQDPPAA